MILETEVMHANKHITLGFTAISHRGVARIFLWGGYKYRLQNFGKRWAVVVAAAIVSFPYHPTCQ